MHKISIISALLSFSVTMSLLWIYSVLVVIWILEDGKAMMKVWTINPMDVEEMTDPMTEA